MSGGLDSGRLAAWHEGALAEKELAAALLCEVEAVRFLLGTPGFKDKGESGKNGSPSRLPPRYRVGLAISHALHRQAGLSLAGAADVVAGSWRICDSVLATVDFFPPAEREPVRASPVPPCAERDPLMLFAPHANEELPIPAVDEYMDVIDGRRIVWRKPCSDAYGLACELHRLSDVTAHRDAPALRQEFLAVLGRLREPADQTAEWIGAIVDCRFRPRPDRFADATPFLRRGVEFASDTFRFAEAYRTRISVNVSLAARSMKRRILGLSVTDPLERPVAPRQSPEGRMPCT